MDIAELKAGVADVSVTYKGRSFTVGYRPESVTEDDLATLESFQGKTGVEFLSAVIPSLARLLVRWSLTTGDQPLALGEEGVKYLPPQMRVSILEAIMSDFFNSGNAKPSDDGSSTPGASEGTAPTMPSSSGAPNGQASPLGISPGSLTLVAP